MISSGVGQDIKAEVKQYESLSDEQKYYESFGFSDYRIEKTIFGFEIKRWKYSWKAEYERASISLPRKVFNVDEIIVSMRIERDNYERNMLVFDEMVSNFRFLD